MSRLAELGRSRAAQIQRFRDSPEAQMLAELAQVHCLLELSKLAAGARDLGEYLTQMLEVLVEYFPMEGYAVWVEGEGVPALKAIAGTIEASPNVRSYPLASTVQAAGELLVAEPAGEAGEAPAAGETRDFFSAVAEQLGASLQSIIANERLRRKAAAASAQTLAATISDPAQQEDLQALTDALASLPNATGATLVLEVKRLGPPLALQAGNASGPAHEHRLPFNDGALTAAVSWTAEPTTDDRAVLASVVETLAASFDRAEAAYRLKAEAESDPLTGLANRRRASRDLAAALGRAERHDEHVSLLFLDLDHFKAVNDTYGHAVGDDLLRTVGQQLVGELRGYDTAARFGGEEFVIILPATDGPAAEIVASRILSRLPEWSRPVIPDGTPQTTSIGIAVYPEHAASGDGLLRAADKALYQAKAAGRNTYRFFT